MFKNADLSKHSSFLIFFSFILHRYPTDETKATLCYDKEGC